MSMNLIRVPYPAAVAGDFDPTTVSNCTMDIFGDQSSLSSLVDTDPVGGTTVWANRVTPTNEWSQGTVANRPILKTDGPNSRRYVRFDGVNDRLDYDVDSSALLTLSAFTGCAVVRPQVAGHATMTENGRNIFTSNGYVGLCLLNSGGNNKFAAYVYNGSYHGAISSTTYSLNTWYIVEFWWDGTTLRIRVNNDSPGTVTPGSNPSQLSDVPRISGNTATQMDLARLTTYNVNLSNVNKDAVRNGYAAYYAITIP